MTSQANGSRISGLTFTSPTSQRDPPSSPPELPWTPTRTVSRPWNEIIGHKGESKEVDSIDWVEEGGRGINYTYDYDYVSGLSISMFESSPDSLANNLDRNGMR